MTDDVLERKVHAADPSQSQEPRREEAGTIGLGPAGQGTSSGPVGRASGLSLSAVSKDCVRLSFGFVGFGILISDCFFHFYLAYYIHSRKRILVAWY